MATSQAMATSCETGLLNLLFLNTDFANVGDAGGLQNSATAGSLYISLHTADPGEGGDQTTNEAAYTDYARVAVARSGAGWSLSSSTMSNVAAVTFPEASGGSETETWVGIGTASSGAGVLLFRIQLTTSIAVVSGVQPNIKASALQVTFE